MIYLVDASAIIDLLLRSDPGEQIRELLVGDDQTLLMTVSHLDAEVFSGLARLCRAGQLDPGEVSELLARLGSLAMHRVPITLDLLWSAWELRDNVAARDALYVAAARAMDARLVTTDDRLARAVPDLTVP